MINELINQNFNRESIENEKKWSSIVNKFINDYY